MRVTRLAVLAAFATVLAGCIGMDGRVSSEEDLSWTRSALSLGNPREAEHYLYRMEESGSLSDDGRTQASLLRAEIELRKGNADRALALAERAVSEPRFSAQAHEVAGKALIQLGRFGEAVGRLESALAGYEDSADVSRAADLISVAEGFDAYASGDPAAARRQWSRIQDPQLASSVRAALDQAGAGEATVSAR